MSAPPPAPASRLDYLDGLRGWASLMVVLSHLWGQFARHNSALYSSEPMRLISDGHFAVLIFFVLSGTALSLRFARRPQSVPLVWLVAARYVRLVVPIAATTLIICILLKFQWYGSADAATAAKSPIFLGPRAGLSTTFLDAARFALYDVLFDYDETLTFNTSLWTMPVEFLGSVLIYVLLFALSLAPGLRRRWKMLVGGVLAAVLMIAGKPLAGCFCCGFVIADMLFAPARVLAWGRWAGVALLAVTAALVAWQGDLDDQLGTIAATGAVMSVAAWPVLRRLLSTRLSRWLGTISFPLYLIHVVVVDALAWPFLALVNGGLSAAAATHLCVAIGLPASFLAAWLLMPIENASIRWSRAVGSQRLRGRPLAPTRR